MLDDVLRLAADTNLLTVSDAARRLAISQTMAQLLFEELARRGYLQAASATCGVPCEGCGVRDACGAGRQARFWVLTAKGARASTRPRAALDARGGVTEGQDR
jgi:predicted ArsR family transcriptional regulator